MTRQRYGSGNGPTDRSPSLVVLGAILLVLADADVHPSPAAPPGMCPQPDALTFVGPDDFDWPEGAEPTIYRCWDERARELVSRRCCDEALLGKEVCWDSLNGRCEGDFGPAATRLLDPEQFEEVRKRRPLTGSSRNPEPIEHYIRRQDDYWLNHHLGDPRDIPYHRRHLTAQFLVMDIEGVSGAGIWRDPRGRPVIKVEVVGEVDETKEAKIRSLYPGLRVDVVHLGPLCESVGGTCRSSPIDGFFSADCEREFGEIRHPNGACRAANRGCCIKPDGASGGR